MAAPPSALSASSERGGVRGRAGGKQRIGRRLDTGRQNQRIEIQVPAAGGVFRHHALDDELTGSQRLARIRPARCRISERIARSCERYAERPAKRRSSRARGDVIEQEVRRLVRQPLGSDRFERRLGYERPADCLARPARIHEVEGVDGVVGGVRKARRNWCASEILLERASLGVGIEERFDAACIWLTARCRSGGPLEGHEVLRCLHHEDGRVIHRRTPLFPVCSRQT
jgi:hypothetical protein